MRLLLAEDERSLSKAVKVMLEKNNYVVDAVYDGNEALEYLSLENYDAVILDIMLPGRNGIEVLKKLREKGDYTPVLILSAKSEIDDKVQGLDCGANDYMTKPFSTKELLARLRAMTRVTLLQNDNCLKLGNIQLNSATYELSSPYGNFRLTGKEYQMMELLLRNPGNVFSTERFMERIWGHESDVEINVVWVYISYLRKKLIALKATVEIKATRNVGYSLEVKHA